MHTHGCSCEAAHVGDRSPCRLSGVAIDHASGWSGSARSFGRMVRLVVLRMRRMRSPQFACDWLATAFVCACTTCTVSM